MSKHHSKSGVASSSVDSGSDQAEQSNKDLLSSVTASLTLHLAPLLSQMASLQEDFRSFKTDTRSSMDAIHAKIETNYDASTNNVRTLTDALDSRIDNIYEELQLHIEALPKPPRPTDPPPLSPHTPDALAQTITNCTYPNAPLLSHHPTHVVSWFRQSILRKTN